jgi:16S rRNA U1498 N3-methylase RsmE
VNNEALLKDIEKLRKKMIAVGSSRGFTSEETIRLSNKLDNLINLQMRILKEISA